MPPYELRGGVDYDVCPVLEGPAYDWCGDRVVDHEGYAGLVGDGGDGFKVWCVQFRVSDRLGKYEPHFRCEGLPEILRVGGIHEDRLDPHFFER